eukprot:3275675-Amphidinium_carterae.1
MFENKARGRQLAHITNTNRKESKKSKADTSEFLCCGMGCSNPLFTLQGDEGCNTVARFLRENVVLKSLDLRGNNIRADGLVVLAHALRSCGSPPADLVHDSSLMLNRLQSTSGTSPFLSKGGFREEGSVTIEHCQPLLSSFAAVEV